LPIALKEHNSGQGTTDDEQQTEQEFWRAPPRAWWYDIIVHVFW